MKSHEYHPSHHPKKKTKNALPAPAVMRTDPPIHHVEVLQSPPRGLVGEARAVEPIDGGNLWIRIDWPEMDVDKSDKYDIC